MTKVINEPTSSYTIYTNTCLVNLTVNHVVLLFPPLTSPRGSQVYYWGAPWAAPLWKREPLTSALPSVLEPLFLDHQWGPKNEQNGRLGTQSQPPKNQSELRSCVQWTRSRVSYPTFPKIHASKFYTVYWNLKQSTQQRSYVTMYFNEMYKLPSNWKKP